MDKGYLNVSELSLLQDKKQLYIEVKAIMPKVKRLSGKVVREEIEKRGLLLSDVAGKLEIDLGGFSKRLSSGFALPYNSLTLLSHEILRKSCQEVFLGFYTPAVLSKDLSCIIEVMESSSKIKESLLAYIDDIFENEGTKTYKVDPNELILERLEEYASDRGFRLDNMFGCSVPSVYTGIKACSEQKRSSPQLSTVSFFALALKTSLDYFVSLDYTGIALGTAKGVCLFGDSRVIKERWKLSFISKYLRLTRDGKDLIFARALSLAIKTNIA